MADGWWNALPFVGNVIDAATQPSRDRKSRDFQKKMWQDQKRFTEYMNRNQIQWRVNDAEKAGLHPLAALGVNPASGPSMSVGDTGGGGPDFGGIGQDLSRAIQAAAPADQRDQKLKDLAIEGAQADVAGKHLANAVTAAQLRKLEMVGPPAPSEMNGHFISGQGDSPLIKSVPQERVKGLPGRGSSEPGAITSVGWEQTEQGGWMPVPSGDLKQRIEDNIFHEGRHFISNNVMPYLDGGYFKPPRHSEVPLKKGHRWEFSPSKGYYQVPIRVDARGASELKFGIENKGFGGVVRGRRKHMPRGMRH